MASELSELLNGLLSGERRALARFISRAEDDADALFGIREKVRAHCGKAFRIGITGPPGAGKSTLVDRLITYIRREGLSVGVIAVDPTSPVSGGAVLGDRLRMQRHYLDEGVFIRSMATRGSQDGLSQSVAAAVELLDAFGKDIIIIETVGVGQTEVGITQVADLVVLVMVPESGDGVQALKAGVAEVADIIVVNKADRDGADRLAEEFRDAFTGALGERSPEVLTTQAVNGVGIAELYSEIDKHRVNC